MVSTTAVRLGPYITGLLYLFWISASGATNHVPMDASPQGQASQELLSLDDAVTHALAANPALARARSRAQAFATKVPQAGALPDPRLSLNAMNVPTDTFALDQEAMTQMQLGLTQAFPFFGKRRLRSNAASETAAAALADSEEVRLQLISDVKSAWWRLFYFDRAIEIVKRNKELLKQFVEIARTKYRVGIGLQQDVLLAQVEVSKLMDREIKLDNMRRNADTRLKALLSLDSVRALRLPVKVNRFLPALPAEASLQKIATKKRPLLATRQHQVQAAKQRLDLSKKGTLPDFKLTAAYGYRQAINPSTGNKRSDLASVMFSMNIPLYAGRKQKQNIQQRSAEWLAQKQMQLSTQDKVTATVSRLAADYKGIRRQAALFERGILPQARQTVASMLAAYQVNKVDFLNLVRAQITVYNYETQYWQALSDARRALSALAAAVGKEKIHE